MAVGTLDSQMRISSGLATEADTDYIQTGKQIVIS